MTDQYDNERMDRTPPADLHAEASVLGSMLLSRQAILDVTEIINNPDQMFYRPAHATIYKGILALIAAGEPADPLLLTDHLKRCGDIDRAGGPAYIHRCVESVATAANAAYYAQIVRNLALLRRVVDTGTRVAQLGYEAQHDPEQAAQVVDAAAAELQALVSSLGTKSDSREWKLDRILEHVVDEYQNPSNNALPLPWKDLQAAVPMEPGDLVVIGARPGIGKSVVLVDIARHVAIEHGLRVQLASMEMSHLQIGQRIVAAEATLHLHNIRGRSLGDIDERRLDKRVGEILAVDVPLYVDDRPGRTVSSWRKRLRQLQADGQLPAVLIVDYLQIAKAETGPGTNRTGEVDSLAAGLKELAQEFGIVVIAAAQVNRALAQRTDKTPTMADLRESGGIEANASVVLLLHREDAYDKESPRSGEFDFVVAKNRMGRSGIKITCAFQGHYSRVIDMGAA